MALPELNPGIENLSQDSALYALYTRYYENMVSANDVDTPTFEPTPAELDENGYPTADFDARVQAGIAYYSEIQMRNAAYNSAVAVLSSIGGNNGNGTGSGFVARAGDSMLGTLRAKYGFEAGYNGTKIFDTTIVTEDGDIFNKAHVYGCLEVDDRIEVGDDGIYLDGNQTLYYEGDYGKIVLAGTNITLDGDVESSGSITVGDIVISIANDDSGTENEIYNGENVYYHAGNSNNEDEDWAAKDLEVFGNLTVHGNQSFGGLLSALHGFELGADDTVMFQSVVQLDENEEEIVDKWLGLKSFIDLDNGTGLTYNGHPILKAGKDSNNEYRVDFGAPAMKMYLGASDGDTLTSRIVLASDIYNYANTFRIISRIGDGNFPNSFSAGCAASGPTVMQTYYEGVGNYGLVMSGLLRFDSVNGPFLSIGESERELKATIPYNHVVESSPYTEYLPVTMKFVETTSLFRNLSLAWSATMEFGSASANMEFFRFGKPVEAGFFSINSSQYKTKLGENILFFDDGVFLEGVTGGIYHSGNATFSGSISSTTFASGFAGYGWAVKADQLYGGHEATFDSLVVRKKMRVYELEVQKISATNGSLWVSDACSGDSVTEIV